MKLALLCLVLAGCIFEDEGVAPELTNLSCSPTTLAAAPYHVQCSVEVSDEDHDTQSVNWAVIRADNYTVAHGYVDLGNPGPTRATAMFAFDLPSPVMVGTYTLQVDVTDLSYGNGDRASQAIVVQ
jgi:hypothetical protein